MLSFKCGGRWADVNASHTVAVRIRCGRCVHATSVRPSQRCAACIGGPGLGRHRCCYPSSLPGPRHDCRYLCGLQQTCRKIIVRRVKIRNDAGKLRRTVTRCNNHSKRSGIYVSSPSQKKKIAVGQLTLYYWHIALGPSIRKQSVALIYGCRGRSSDWPR